MNHEDVLLKLETKIINNGKGHARASAHGLRAIMETMLHGSQFYMLFKEAFHIYGSFFFIFIYALTILYYNYNWPRQMTRGWVLLLLNIRLHVKGFNKLIYIGTFK